jgi:hypothetical protein
VRSKCWLVVRRRILLTAPAGALVGWMRFAIAVGFALENRAQGGQGDERRIGRLALRCGLFARAELRRSPAITPACGDR